MTLEERNAKLDEAKALVLKGWTQGASARTANGLPVAIDNPKAVLFCAIGACERVGIDFELVKNSNPCLIGSLSVFNDTPGRTKYEVAALFDHAKEMPL